MADGDVVIDLEQAVVRTYKNELAIDQKSGGDNHPSFDDPIKLRFGSWEPADGRKNFYLGAISFDLLTGDQNRPKRWEKVMLAIKLDPDPTLEVYTQETADSTQDATMKARVRIGANGIEGGAGAARNELTSPNGRYRAVLQDDSNFVVYDTQAGGGWRAFWSWLTGKL